MVQPTYLSASSSFSPRLTCILSQWLFFSFLKQSSQPHLRTFMFAVASAYKAHSTDPQTDGSILLPRSPAQTCLCNIVSRALTLSAPHSHFHFIFLMTLILPDNLLLIVYLRSMGAPGEDVSLWATLLSPVPRRVTSKQGDHNNYSLKKKRTQKIEQQIITRVLSSSNSLSKI